MTAENNGILNVLLAIGNFDCVILPFIIWHWGTVGEIKGYLTPLAKCGEYKVVNPINPVMFGIKPAFYGAVADLPP